MVPAQGRDSERDTLAVHVLPFYRVSRIARFRTMEAVPWNLIDSICDNALGVQLAHYSTSELLGD